ncbi:lipase chaperone [Paraburkholderia acidicola]|uniref:Lipase helper protein n=1 Tax=Paraburkholderia acidicola TaxID=1912599 RepID=A0ABV1LJM6_9BURK
MSSTISPHRFQHREAHAQAGGFAETFNDDSATPGTRPFNRLDGTTVPDGLKADASGHLIKSRRVRDVFDYFLVESGEASAQQIDAAVVARIDGQLSGVARKEAVDLWHRYSRYRVALRALAGTLQRTNPDSLTQILQQRLALRAQFLPDVAQAWFGDEEQADRDQLDRMSAMADPSLTVQQRSERLTAIDARDPTLMKARDAGADVTALSQIVAKLQRAHASPDEIGAAVAASSDPETGARVAKQAAQDADWSARYATYRAALQAIAPSTGGASAGQDAQLENLRSQYFPIPAEAMRAAALDLGHQ